MKNTGLKIPEKDQTHVTVVLLDFYRANIIGTFNSFSNSLFSVLVS